MRWLSVMVLLISVECLSQDSTRFEPIFGTSNEPQYALDSLIQTSDKTSDIYGKWQLVKIEGSKVKDSIYASIELEFRDYNRIIITSSKKTNSYIYKIEGNNIELYYTTDDVNFVKPVNAQFHFSKVGTRKIEVIWSDGFSKVEDQIWTFRKK